MRCEDVCVTDFDCVSVTGAQHQSTVTNFSCHYIEPAETLTCRWRPRHVAGATSSSLIFRPKKGFRHCSYIFNLSGLFNVTLKTKNLETNNETLSEPHMVDMHLSVKAPRPNVTLIKASETMLNITWSNGQWGAEMWETKYCKIRRRSVNKDQWMETPTLVPVKRGDEMMYAMDGLKPFTRYMLAVSCIGHYGHWSDWSLVAAGMTQESVPAKPPHVSYSIRASGSEGTQHLLLIWAPLHPRYSNGKVLGYNVTFYPPKYLGLKRTVTVTGLKISLEVLMERYEVAVSAYNSAGESPRRRLTVDAGHHRTLAPVRGLWVHSKDGVLWLQWDVPPQPASELAIEWRPTDSTHSLWWRVNSSIATPVALPGEIRPRQAYIISVYPVHEELCGPASSIEADLQYGSLVDVVGLEVVTVTRHGATVQWEWQRKTQRTSIHRYRVALQGGENAVESIPLFPDMHRYSFSKLMANSKYTVHVYIDTDGGNFSVDKQEFSTCLLETEEVISIAVPVGFVILAAGVIAKLSQFVYRKYIFPKIANPKLSPVGHWLLDPMYSSSGLISVLNLEDFVVADRCLLHIEQQIRSPSMDCPTEDVDTTYTSAEKTDYIDSDPSPGSTPSTCDTGSTGRRSPVAYNEGYVLNCPGDT
ncbi:interleukin-6 receptor subunit beta isoform X2 [Denticeps clupeoides]|nr:interleukin-6 receptor subunit beta-like isoform X2 [Denticeps clupeoides]